MIECPKCGQPLMSSLEFCPQCKARNPGRTPRFGGVPWWGFLFAAACALPLLGGNDAARAIGCVSAVACALASKRRDWFVTTRVAACAGIMFVTWIAASLPALILRVALIIAVSMFVLISKKVPTERRLAAVMSVVVILGAYAWWQPRRIALQQKEAYEKACDAGDPRGCNDLGTLYEAGEGVPKDVVRAASLYHEACEHDVGVACFNLGFLHETGEGVPKNPTRAAGLFHEACDLDYPDGCTHINTLRSHKGGWAVSAEALWSDFSGCYGGNSRDCFNLGYTNAFEILDNSVLSLMSGAKNAVAPFQKACDAGVAIGCNDLGFLYEQGEGVPKDPLRAAAFFQKACDGGIGCFNLGFLYAKGEGVPKDTARASELFRKACDGVPSRSSQPQGEGVECQHWDRLVAEQRGQALLPRP